MLAQIKQIIKRIMKQSIPPIKTSQITQIKQKMKQTKNSTSLQTQMSPIMTIILFKMILNLSKTTQTP